jgi:hypothetical protein
VICRTSFRWRHGREGERSSIDDRSTRDSLSRTHRCVPAGNAAPMMNARRLPSQRGARCGGGPSPIYGIGVDSPHLQPNRRPRDRDQRRGPVAAHTPRPPSSDALSPRLSPVMTGRSTANGVRG